MNFVFSEETKEKIGCKNGAVDKGSRYDEICDLVRKLAILAFLTDGLGLFLKGFAFGYSIRIYDERADESISEKELLGSILASYLEAKDNDIYSEEE